MKMIQTDALSDSLVCRQIEGTHLLSHRCSVLLMHALKQNRDGFVRKKVKICHVIAQERKAQVRKVNRGVLGDVCVC
jgi:hypothetical protein